MCRPYVCGYLFGEDAAYLTGFYLYWMYTELYSSVAAKVLLGIFMMLFEV